MDRSDDIGGERIHLQPEIKRDEIVRRDHHQHPERGEKHQHRELEAVEPLCTRKALGHDDRNGGRDQRRDLHEAGEGIDDEGAAEGAAFPAAEGDHESCHRKHEDRKHVDGRC